MNAKTRGRLRDQFESLDPFALHQQLERRLGAILKHTVKEKPVEDGPESGTGGEAS